LKKHNNSGKKSEQPSKRAKSPRGPVQRDTKEVLAELVGKLREKLDPKKVTARSAGEEHQRDKLGQISTVCRWAWIWGTNGATTAFWVWREKRWRKGSCLDTAGRCRILSALNAPRVVVEVGTHSAWGETGKEPILCRLSTGAP
jgi:hypothetical protein